MFELTDQGKELINYAKVEMREEETREDDVHRCGTLSVVEYSFGKCFEWKPVEESVVSENQDQDPEWSLVNTHTSRTRSSSEGPESLGRKNVRIMFSDLKSIRVHQGGQQLVFIQKDSKNYVAFFQLSSAENFLNSLKAIVKLANTKNDKHLYRLEDEVSTDLNKFDSSRLFHDDRSELWRFVQNFHNHPCATALETFSKITDVGWVYNKEKRPVEQTVSDLLNHSLNTNVHLLRGQMDSGEEYEVIGVAESGILLPPRPLCLRGSPLTQEQWERFKDSEGRINDPCPVKELIFRGGISHPLRYELWKFLLHYYPWNSTTTERVELRKKKNSEYFAMKLQWKSMTTAQENRFSGFRERKSLIEKDVKRTDRAQEYYAGDNNPHLAQLYDILMTYVMYNFDLGYVQGMSDLLSPILCLMDNEVDAFWCFVGFMDKVSTNFEIEQVGMKTQLCQLHNILAVTEPQLAQYLDKHESGNMFFCFRWLLVLFKREFNTIEIMELWEILWTDLPCINFHLLFCVAILDTEKSKLMENHYGFTEILKHINDLSLHIELPRTISKAEGIYNQLIAVESQLPDNVRIVMGLKPLIKSTEISDHENKELSNQITDENEESHSISNNVDDDRDIKFGNNEVSFEHSLNLSFV